ncbi:hypothetical protein E0L36_18155 [Streptomyces sp. AJS327]|uniref:copper resistance CopC/CopD family protein n=1 Tax=Streptomyces sp. AJS327 TaxID=2545265 RepID=UPI0015DD5801|nr:copper resistance protein CopC [Streptomyces sp. AJS327]MBA0052729.1 hypothetical protein [Streptomyces sp. AJS327]
MDTDAVGGGRPAATTHPVSGAPPTAGAPRAAGPHPAAGDHPGPAARWLVTALFSAVCALLGVLGAATPAAAHAVLTDSAPGEDAVQSTAPQRVTLDFSESVSMAEGSLRVLDPRGERVDTGPVRDLDADGTVRRGVDLERGLPRGTFTVVWQAVSADSHPISGAFTFSVGAPSKTSVQLPESGSGSSGGLVGTLYDGTRYAAYGGFALLVGGAAFVLLCWPGGASARPVRRVARAGWLTLTAATLAQLLLRGPYTGSGELSDAVDLTVLRAVVATDSGTALVSRLLLLGVAALFLAVLFGTYARHTGTGTSTDTDTGCSEVERPATEAGTAEPATPETDVRTVGTRPETDGGRAEDGAPGGVRWRARQRDLTLGLGLGGGVLTVGLAATWALAEHASTGIQTSVAVPAAITHLLAVALWLGGLATLLGALHTGPPPPRAAVRRFSRTAFVCVTVLLATGLYQSWRQVGSWSALTGTEYGRLLLVKAGLVGTLLAVAWVSRRRLAHITTTPALAAPRRSPENTASSASDAGTPAEPDPEAGTPATTATPAARAPGTKAPGTAASGTDRPETSARGERGLATPTVGPNAPVVRGSAREAQLARQRAAMAAARRKRERDADPHRSALRRSVLTEAGVAALLLAVTTALTGTEPGRTAETSRAAQDSARAARGPVETDVAFDTGGPKGRGTVGLTLDPGRAGTESRLHLRITGRGSAPLDPPEVKVALTHPGKKIGPLPARPKPVAGDPGHWLATGLQLPVAGEWEVAVTVRTSDIDQVTETTTVEIG